MATSSDRDDAQPSGPTVVVDGDAAVAHGRRRFPWRRIAVATLVVLASVAMLVTTIAVYSSRTVLNTDVFVRRVGGVVDEPAVQEVFATYLADEVLKAVDAPTLVASALPAGADRLTIALVAGIRERVIERITQLFATEEFQQLFERLLRRTHEAAVNLLEGDDGGALEIEGNAVVLDTVPIIAELLRGLGLDGLVDRAAQLPTFGGDDPPSENIQKLNAALGLQLPPDFGQLTVMRSDSIPRLQDALTLVRRLVVGAVILTIALVAVALVLSRQHARTAAQLGIGMAAGMVIGLVALRWMHNALNDAILDPAARDAAQAIASQVLGSIEKIMAVLVGLGFVVAVIGFLSGDSSTARRVRSTAAPAAASGRGSVRAFLDEHGDGVRLTSLALSLVAHALIGLNLWGLIVAAAVAGAGYALTLAGRRDADDEPLVPGASVASHP